MEVDGVVHLEEGRVGEVLHGTGSFLGDRGCESVSVVMPPWLTNGVRRCALQRRHFCSRRCAWGEPPGFRSRVLVASRVIPGPRVTHLCSYARRAVTVVPQVPVHPSPSARGQTGLPL
jgi:hypothetical protein